MSTRLELIITGDSRDATQAIEALQRSGAQAASILEREFAQLGMQSELSFENQRKAADDAYQRIKTSGVATARELQRAQDAYAATLAKIDRAEGLHTTRLEEIDRGQNQAGSSAMSLSSAYGQLASALAAIGVGVFISKMTEAKVVADRVNASLRTTFGATASREFAFVEQEAERLGLALMGTATSYGRLAAAAKGTIMEGQPTRDLFIATAEAATALGLAAEETDGTLNAFMQMLSKGNVQAEELRGQLGDRLVGAFRIAAQAMGKSEQELNKMLERGEILASDLLPRMAAELHKTFGEGALAGAKGLQAELNRLDNAWQKLLRTAGDSAPLVSSVQAATAATGLLGNNLDAAAVGMAAFTAGGVITGLSSMAGWLSRIAMTAGGITAVSAALAGVVGAGAYLATKKLLSWGDDALFDGKLGYGEKPLKEAQKRAEEIRKLKEKNDAATAAAMNVGPAGLGADVLAKMREEQEKQVKTVLPLLDRYSRSLNDLGREQLRLADSGFSRDMQRQSEYFNRTATAASNLTAPIQSYLAVIDQVYGAQKRGQEAVLAAMVQIGASDAARLQQQINLGTVEKTMLESRRKAWEIYAGDVEKLVTTAWDNIAKKEEALLQSRLATQGMKDALRDKIEPKQEIDPFTARLQQQDALRALEQKAMASANPAEQLRLLEQAQKGWAALDSEVKIGEDILISTDTAARQALDNVDRLGKAIDTLRQQEATQAAEALQDLVMAKGEAEAAITALDTALQALDTRIAGMTRKIAVTGEDKTTPVVDDVKRALDTLKDKTITITANYVSNIPGSAAAAAGGEKPAEAADAAAQDERKSFLSAKQYQPRALDGKLATGGPTKPFGTYLVGERGPEILRMGNQGGTVIPNEQIGGQVIQFGDVSFIMPNVTDKSTGEDVARAAWPHLMRLMEQRLLRKAG